MEDGSVLHMTRDHLVASVNCQVSQIIDQLTAQAILSGDKTIKCKNTSTSEPPTRAPTDIVIPPSTQAPAGLLTAAEVSGLLIPASQLNATTSCILMTDESEGHTHLSVARVVYTRLVVKEGIYTAVTQNPFLVRPPPPADM